MNAPTPTTNPELRFRVDGFATLSAGLDYAAQGVTGFNFFSSRGDLETALPYHELRRRAVNLAGRLAGCGAERGDRVAIVAETSPAFVTVFFACQYAGLVPVPLPLCINIGGHDAYVERLRGMLDRGWGTDRRGAGRPAWIPWAKPPRAPTLPASPLRTRSRPGPSP